MTNKGKKMEPPLRLEIDFGEALARFTNTDPAELSANLGKEKLKGPPDKRLGLPDDPVDDVKVTKLRDVRQRKRDRGKPTVR